MRDSGCHVSDWMLDLKQPSKQLKKERKQHPVQRESISKGKQIKGSNNNLTESTDDFRYKMKKKVYTAKKSDTSKNKKKGKDESGQKKRKNKKQKTSGENDTVKESVNAV